MLLLYLFIGFSSQLDDFYSLELQNINGQMINVESFRGKRVLVVNIGSASQHVDQISALQQLYQTHSDSLVILAVPTNDFGNEPIADSLLSAHYYQHYGVTFVISQRMSVTGENQHPLYVWLTRLEKNGAASSLVQSGFQKYLVGKNGELIGMFGASVSPNSQEFMNAFNY